MVYSVLFSCRDIIWKRERVSDKHNCIDKRIETSLSCCHHSYSIQWFIDSSKVTFATESTKGFINLVPNHCQYFQFECQSAKNFPTLLWQQIYLLVKIYLIWCQMYFKQTFIAKLYYYSAKQKYNIKRRVKRRENFWETWEFCDSKLTHIDRCLQYFQWPPEELLLFTELDKLAR